MFEQTNGLGLSRHEPANMGTLAKSKTGHFKGEQSPQGNRGVTKTPFFFHEQSEPKCQGSGHSVKEFSLGKPSRARRGHLFSKGDELPTSKESNKENRELGRRLEDLKRIRSDYVKLVEGEILERSRFNQSEFAALNDDITLFLNDDTRINGSFINTPTKTRVGAKSRSGNKQRKEDSFCIMNSSQMMNSIDRAEKTPDRMNDSIFLKSHEFPRLLKRKTSRAYTKVLIPVRCGDDSSSSPKTATPAAS